MSRCSRNCRAVLTLSRKFSILPVLVFSAAVWTVPTAPARAETLKERQVRVLEVVGKVSPAVVAITGTSPRGMMGSGSGVIVSRDGLILTAGHVLAATGGELLITLPGGREVKGKALGRDMNRDAALAQITEPGEYPFVSMAPAESVKEGEWVLALGHPGGYDPLRGAPLRVGRLWETDTKSYFRSDCTVSGGDSGGPLFDLEGRVVGIHSSISQNLSENRHVPVGVFEKEMDRLKTGEVWGRLSNLMPGMRDPEDADRPEGGQGNSNGRENGENRPRSRGNRPGDGGGDGPDARPQRRLPREADPAETPQTRNRVYLGVVLSPADNGSGAQVMEIADGSPAARAGLELEDIIIRIDDTKISSHDDVLSKVGSAKPGEKLKLTVRRGGSEKEITVTLGELPGE